MSEAGGELHEERVALHSGGGFRLDHIDGGDDRTDVRRLPDGGTRVGAVACGFSDDVGAELVIAATEGFTIVLCDLKATLETGRSGDMVRD